MVIQSAMARKALLPLSDASDRLRTLIGRSATAGHLRCWGAAVTRGTAAFTRHARAGSTSLVTTSRLVGDILSLQGRYGAGAIGASLGTVSEVSQEAP